MDFIDQHTKLIITGEAELSYQPDGEVTIDGYIEIKLPVEDSSNSGHDGWLIPGKNDVCGRDVLKKNHPELTDAEIDAATKAMEQARREASGLVVGDGTSMDIEVREGIYRVPWQAYLQNWLDGHSRMVRTYTRVSRRGEMPDPRCVLPGHARMGYRLNIVLDTSGSMEDLLPSALGAIACFCERNAVDCIKIAECDDELQAIKEISSDDLRKYTVKGCGGTDMTPGLTLFENDPGATAVIVITDGRFEVNDLPRRLPFAVLWCLIGSVRHINAPYGKQVHIDL